MALVDIAKNTDYNIDRTHGTKEVIQYIKENDGASNVLDIFAGDGSFCSWLLYRVSDKLPNVTHLEWDKDKFSSLNERFGRHRNSCFNCDSYEWIRNTSKQYDFIFCDNGMGDNEYFDIIPLVKPLIKGPAWFVHNINVRPYGNFLTNKTWQQHRSHFYGVEDTQDCEPMDLLDATSIKLQKHGIVPEYGRLFPREIYEGHIYLYHALWKIK